MAKFLFLYRHTVPDAASSPPSPEMMQQIMAAWNAWIDKFRKSGHMIDPGDGLQPMGKVMHPAGVVTDGPFVEAKEILGGFSVLKADSLDHALTIARECPAAHGGGTIEIREFAGWI